MIVIDDSNRYKVPVGLFGVGAKVGEWVGANVGANVGAAVGSIE
jgi:hypothetical protein